MEGRTINDEKKNHHIWLTISLFFLGILFFLIYTSFYNPSLGDSITGNVISNNKLNLIEIDSTLTSPEKIKVKGKIGKIDLRTGDPNVFFVGKERFDLDKVSIIIDDFDGDVNFNKKNITKFNGKASKIFIEGIPITSDSEIKVYFEGEFKYNYLKLNNFYLNSLSYVTSGIVKLNDDKAIINLDNENFKIEKFQGDLEIRDNRFKLKGVVKRSNLGFINVKAVESKEIIEEEKETS